MLCMSRIIRALSPFVILSVVWPVSFALPSMEEVFASDDVGTVEVDSNGDRIWFGQVSEELDVVDSYLTKIKEKYRNNIVQTVLTSDRQVIEVYMRDVRGPGYNELLKLAADHPDKIRLKQTKVDASVQEAVEAKLMERGAQKLGLVSVSLDVTKDQVKLGIERDILESRSPLEFKIDDLGVKIKVSAEDRVAENSGRDDDSPYYSAGGKIIGVNNRHVTCSLGVPIELDGKYFALTAGHCKKDTFKNGSNTRVVGSVYTTTYVKTRQYYGDWMLLSGQHYALNLFSGGPGYDAATLPIAGGDFGQRTVGQALCTSGSTTGQICRFYVTATGKSTYDMYGRVAAQTEMMHDQNLDGVADCGGFRNGDSGGIVYYSNGHGGMIAYGIIQGQFPYPACNSTKRYFVTELRGVRAWNPRVNVG